MEGGEGGVGRATCVRESGTRVKCSLGYNRCSLRHEPSRCFRRGAVVYNTHARAIYPRYALLSTRRSISNTSGTPGCLLATAKKKMRKAEQRCRVLATKKKEVLNKMDPKWNTVLLIEACYV